MNQKNVVRRSCDITDRDYLILRFLWKWKLGSTSAIARKFFPAIKVLSAYRRLMFLEAGGYVKCSQIDGRRRELWTLTDQGFRYILPKLGELQQKGYSTENIYHDYFVAAFHLGEWLTRQPENSQTYSEQQLRRFPPDAWPTWLPTSIVHRPDGYSISINGSRRSIIAFEVEISVKERSRYESVVAYYDSEETIETVLWLVDSKTTFNSVEKSFSKFGSRHWNKHHFVMLSDFIKNGWWAKVINGKFMGRPMTELMNQADVRDASDCRQGTDVLALLDSRKYPVDSDSCPNSEKP